tara:strand:+ start:1990 stop:2403 length:414 start_codon:yes stop_codon:yes gene_type:complete
MMSWEQAEVVRLLKSQPGTQYQEGTDGERTVIRDWIRSLLQSSVVSVEFVKSDGSVREMKCTLNTDYIPVAAVPGVAAITAFGSTEVDGIKRGKNVLEDIEMPKEPTSIRVYDTEANGWRSFRYDRLRRITAALSFE